MARKPSYETKYDDCGENVREVGSGAPNGDLDHDFYLEGIVCRIADTGGGGLSQHDRIRIVASAGQVL